MNSAEIKTNLESVIPEIKAVISAPYFHAHVSMLGRPSLMVTIGLDDKSTWINNIFENSRYCRFDLTVFEDSTVIENFQSSSRALKVRKVTIKGPFDAAKLVEAFRKISAKLA